MRKIFVLVAVLLFACCTYADAMRLNGLQRGYPGAGDPLRTPYTGGGVTGGGGGLTCTTSDDAVIGTDYTANTRDDSVTDGWVALKVALSATTRITAFKGWICDNNANTGSAKMMLYTHNAGTDKPNTLVSGTDVTLATSSIDPCNTYGAYEFALGTPKDSVSSGTYWIVGTQVSSALIPWGYDGVVGQRACYGADGTTWTCLDDYAFMVAVLGCQ